jgi:hypothetical protein
MENSNFLVRNSAALTFKLEIDFWLAQVAQTLIGMIAFLVYNRQSFAFRLICSALSVAGPSRGGGGGGGGTLLPGPSSKGATKKQRPLKFMNTRLLN